MPRIHITNPLIKSVETSADPYIIKHKGQFYYCLSDSTNTQIWLWRSPTLAGLDSTQDKAMVWQAPMSGATSKEVWAPELHFLNGKWYIYFTADNGHNENHRPYVLESLQSTAFGEYNPPRKLQWQDEDFWGIDATVFQNEYDGKMYMVWSGWPGNSDGRQNLYIAPMDSPVTLSGPRHLLSEPEYRWEAWINEGPSVLQRDGRIFISYSANASWTARYCLGLLYAEANTDLLDRANWKKHPNPILKADYQAGIYGPGHNCFFEGPDGESWIAFHVKTLAEDGWVDRKVYVQPVSWSATNFPHMKYK